MKNKVELKSWFEDGKLYLGEYVKHKLNQLDEPEVLSQEWIEDNEYRVIEYPESVVPSKKLQALLVPEVELPVIPEFVAEWIEEVKPDNSLRVAFEYIAQQKRDNYDGELAFWVEEGNSETFAKAWLDGYTVEEEQKYYVLNKNNKLMLRKYTRGVRELDISNSMTIDSEFFEFERFALTEQEIKDYDERFWPFAVKVEELEE